MTDDSLDDILTPQPKKPTPYNEWKEAVLVSYPGVFFPSLSAKKKKILDSVYAAIGRAGLDPKDFYKWVVDHWTLLDKKTDIKSFGKYPYPEISLVLFHYDILINLYKTEPTLVNVAPKKQVNLKKWLNGEE